MSELNESVRVTIMFIFLGAPFAIGAAALVGLGVVLSRRRREREAR